MERNSMTCIVDGSHGIYIPKRFAVKYADQLSERQKKILFDGPDNDDYWYTWDDIVRTMIFRDEEGNCCRLLEDGDLFAVQIDNE